MSAVAAPEPGDESSDDPTDPLLPEVGEDLSPTNEMIVKGRVGNGRRDQFTPQLANRIQVERREMQRELKKGRREAYEEGVKDTLKAAGDLQSGLIEQGNAILKRLQDGAVTHDELTAVELGTLKLAQAAGKEAADRSIGKAKTTSEVKHDGHLLHLLMGKVQND